MLKKLFISSIIAAMGLITLLVGSLAWGNPRSPVYAQELPGILPIEQEPVMIDDTQDPARQLLEQQLQQRGPARDRFERMQNILRDPSGGEIKKPVATHTGVLSSSSRVKDPIYFQARYENSKGTPSPALKYQIIVEQNSQKVWDSGLTSLTAPLAAGQKSPYIPFSTASLTEDEATWKITFQLEDGTMTPWSDSTVFTKSSPLPIAPKTPELQNIKYTYDAVGNITRIEDSSGTAATKIAEYTYDDLYRLQKTKISLPNNLNDPNTLNNPLTESYSYDPTGNILSKSDQGSYSYGCTGNEPVCKKTNPQAVTFIDDGNGNTISFEYNINGNLTDEVQSFADGTKVIKQLTWDELDRLKQIEVTNEAGVTTTSSFTYDHTGRRLSKTVSNQFGSETTFYPFEDVEIAADGTMKTSTTANSMHLSTVETKTDGSQRIIFSHTDHLGGGNVLTDYTAEPIQVMDYFPFGSLRVDERYSNFDETKKFTGHELDDESNLYYAKARYYDPEIGRFISQDPLQWRPLELMKKFGAMPQALNFYSYALNNPILLVDPSGESPALGYVLEFLALFGFEPVPKAHAPDVGEEINSNEPYGPSLGEAMVNDGKEYLKENGYEGTATAAGLMLGGIRAYRDVRDVSGLIRSAKTKEIVADVIKAFTTPSKSSKHTLETTGTTDDALELFRSLIKEGSEELHPGKDVPAGSLIGTFRLDPNVSVGFRPSSSSELPTLDIGGIGDVVDGVKKIKFKSE